MPAFVQHRAELLGGGAVELDGAKLRSDIGLLLVVLVLGQGHQLVSGAGQPDGGAQECLLVIVGGAEVGGCGGDITLQLESVGLALHGHTDTMSLESAIVSHEKFLLL